MVMRISSKIESYQVCADILVKKNSKARKIFLRNVHMYIKVLVLYLKILHIYNRFLNPLSWNEKHFYTIF